MNLEERPVAPDPYDLLPSTQSFTMESDDLTDGQPMPIIHTAAGGNISPHLRWHGFPEDTQGFVITCFDPDAPTPSGWWHWTILDLSSECTELQQGAGTSDLELDGAAFHLSVDHGDANYGGAAPPSLDRPHRYIFAVHALDTPTLKLSEYATPAEASFKTLFHTLARARLTVTFATD